MSVWFKQGVYGDLTTICQKAFGLLANFYNSQGLDFLCTSKRDGNHSAGSLHYTGNAFDFKRQGMDKHFIKRILGDSFDIVEYSDKRDIFHVEYDPKN